MTQGKCSRKKTHWQIMPSLKNYEKMKQSKSHKNESNTDEAQSLTFAPGTVGKPDSNSAIEREPIDNTPFTLISQIKWNGSFAEKLHCLALGNRAVTQWSDNAEEHRARAATPEWELIQQLIIFYIDHIDEIKTTMDLYNKSYKKS